MSRPTVRGRADFTLPFSVPMSTNADGALEAWQVSAVKIEQGHPATRRALASVLVAVEERDKVE